MDELVRNLEQAVFPKGGRYRSHARTRAKFQDFRARMPAHLHATGLELVGSIARSAPVQAESLLEWLPDLVRLLPAEVAEEGVGHAVRIARASVTASYGFLSHLLHVTNTLGSGNLGPWVEEGLRLLEQNPSAGRAYFQLHTRQARQGLRQGEHVVHLDEIRDSLRLYVNGISGRRLEVQSTGESLDGFPAGRPWVFPFSDGKGVFLPPAVQAFSSYQENRLFYRILAAHQAGYHEFDTFGFGLLAYLERLARHPVLGRWKPDLQRREGPDDFLSDLQVFFHLFPRPGLAQRIFVTVEDGRVDARLRHRYPGLRADMGPFVKDILSRRPAPGTMPFGASLMELLLQASLDPGRRVEGLPGGLAYVRRLLADRLDKAFGPEATVEDAAVTATELYWFFNGLLKMQFELAELGRGGRLGDPGADGDREYLSADELASLTLLDALGAELEGDRAEAEGLGDLDVPLEFRGETDLGEVQKGLQVAEHLENAASENNRAGNQVLSLDELRRLLEQGLEITVESMREDMLEGPGLFYQNPSQAFPLMPQLKKSQEDGNRALTGQMLSLLRREHRRTGRESDATVHYYDEWDHAIQDYRQGWCRLLEREVGQDGNGFAAKVRADYGPLIPSVRRQFEKIRPEEYRKEKSLLDGEEIDLDRTVEHLIDRMSGLPGTNRLYQQRRKVERDVCTVFLVDMSSSTSEPVCVPVPAEGAPGGGPSGSPSSPAAGSPAAAGSPFLDDGEEGLSRVLSGLRAGPAAGTDLAGSRKRIIDVEKEALLLLAEALRALGDRYAIYGFSGCGRMQVDFYTIKEFSQRYTDQVKDRIGAIEPKGSTRMGTALRHCRVKLGREDARRKNLFLLSDGFPQDQDYGYDRTSHEYGVQDTARALVELEQDGVHTYCITVDRRGEDYLKKMCPPSQYMVIHDILSLPEVLLKLYRKVTT